VKAGAESVVEMEEWLSKMVVVSWRCYLGTLTLQGY
jgi:hypothetical protein